MYYCTTCLSPVGLLTLASDGKNLAGLWLEGQKYHGRSIPGPMTKKDDLSVFDETRSWLTGYFAGKKPSPSSLPLNPTGTGFRQRVWKALCEIPYGQITTYSTIAAKITPESEPPENYRRAVGGAIGHNPISIIIPCHRVIGADGSLTGYAGGVERKVELLALEGVDVSRF